MSTAADNYESSRSRYERCGAALDEHLASCPCCSVGVACPDGDDKAMGEYRAFREWQRDDPAGARTAHQGRG